MLPHRQIESKLQAAVRHVLPDADVSAVLGEAISVGLDNREEAMAYAQQFGRGIDAETADRFVAMYVNDLTIDMGERGRRAVAEVLLRAGATNQPEWVD